MAPSIRSFCDSILNEKQKWKKIIFLFMILSWESSWGLLPWTGSSDVTRPIAGYMSTVFPWWLKPCIIHLLGLDIFFHTIKICFSLCGLLGRKATLTVSWLNICIGFQVRVDYRKSKIDQIFIWKNEK